MKQYHETAGAGRYQIEAFAVACGPDLSVTILGGTGYHVGAAALGTARPPKEGKERSATVSVLCAYEHKDDEVARWAAKYLATALHNRVSVSAGVHIDHASVEELKILMENCEEVCHRLIEKVKQEGDLENGKN